MSFSPAVYSHQNATGTGTGAIIDISACTQGVNPPCMLLTISATATVKIEGSHDGVNFVDFTGGGLTSNDARDLVLSCRFWRSNITANSGSVTTQVGPVSTQTGQYLSPNIATTIYNATSSL